MRSKVYDAAELGQPIPKPRYKCEHVQAGFLTASRFDMENAVVDACYGCYDQYQRQGNLMMTEDGKVVTYE